MLSIFIYIFCPVSAISAAALSDVCFALLSPPCPPPPPHAGSQATGSTTASLAAWWTPRSRRPPCSTTSTQTITPWRASRWRPAWRCARPWVWWAGGGASSCSWSSRPWLPCCSWACSTVSIRWITHTSPYMRRSVIINNVTLTINTFTIGHKIAQRNRLICFLAESHMRRSIALSCPYAKYKASASRRLAQRKDKKQKGNRPALTKTSPQHGTPLHTICCFGITVYR